MERLFWWSHYLVVLGFLVYLPYSKHLHIFLAFPTSFYSDLSPRGQMSNIPAIENEVRSMLELPLKENVETLESFGAKILMIFHGRQYFNLFLAQNVVVVLPFVRQILRVKIKSEKNCYGYSRPGRVNSKDKCF